MFFVSEEGFKFLLILQCFIMHWMIWVDLVRLLEVLFAVWWIIDTLSSRVCLWVVEWTLFNSQEDWQCILVVGATIRVSRDSLRVSHLRVEEVNRRSIIDHTNCIYWDECVESRENPLEVTWHTWPIGGGLIQSHSYHSSHSHR